MEYKTGQILRKIVFRSCVSQPYMYIRHTDDSINIIAAYVDDLLLACSKKEELIEIKRLIADDL